MILKDAVTNFLKTYDLKFFLEISDENLKILEIAQNRCLITIKFLENI